MLDEFLSASVVDRCCLVGFTSASVTARGGEFYFSLSLILPPALPLLTTSHFTSC